jgi:peptidoglycan/LPS O-acetylase OafA/YrhL
MPATTSRARLDYIDGLRAIAVSLVLWFHAQLPGVPGGFLGVDIFFVISGFLITGQIYDGIAAGSFSLAGFYARRILRISPPLLLVLAATLVAACAMRILPADMRRIAESAVASTTLMVPNWYFLKKTDYFAPSAEREPLLHLWSLGVEEQYYLFVPLVVLGLAVIARRRGMSLYGLGLACTAVVLLGSLGAAASGHAKPITVFFSTPLRVWEFAVGGVAILAMRSGFVLTGFVARAGMVAGLLAIAVACSITAIEPHQRLLLQALVVAGAGAVLLGGAFTQSGLALRLLSLRPMAALGLISYSLYLWHWPVLVFWRLTHLDPPSRIESVMAGIVVPLLLAVLTYVWVERPIQRWRQMRGPGLQRYRAIVQGAAASAFAACIALALMGWSTRLNGTDRFRAYAEAEAPIMGKCGTGLSNTLDCRIGSGSDDRVLLWGDSHAMSVSGAIALSAFEAGLSGQLRWAGDCAPLPGSTLYLNNAEQSDCMARNDNVLHSLALPQMHHVTGVVLDAAWALHLGHAAPASGRGERVTRMAEAMTRAIQRLRDLGLRVLVLGPIPEMPYRVPECVFLARLAAGEMQRCGSASRDVDVSQRDVVEALRAATAKFDNVRFVDASAAFCDSMECRPGRDGSLYYSDTNHLTNAGAGVLHERFRDDFAWIFAAPPARQEGWSVARMARSEIRATNSFTPA